MTTWKTSKTFDPSLIQPFLETDRPWAAYAIDLDPRLFAQSTWAVAEADGQVRALALHFKGIKVPVLFLMGDSDGLRAILEEQLCPERVFLMGRPEHEAVTDESYTWEHKGQQWRMVLDHGRFRRKPGECVRLTQDYVGQLAELYSHWRGNPFIDDQIRHGVCYGVLVNGQLRAVAGTHLVSETYGVGTIGGVFTHPDHRRAGYGTATTAAVAAELLDRGVRDIVLSVQQENVGAVRIYERLGFKRYCPFLAGLARRLNPLAIE